MNPVEFYKKFLEEYMLKMKKTIEYKRENNIPLNNYERKFLEIMKERGQF